MNTQKSIIALGLLLASVFILPAARADEWDQASKLTFNQPVQIPGRVLPAGTYWFILVDSLSDRNIVQIFNSDRSTLLRDNPNHKRRASPASRPYGTDFRRTRVDAFERHNHLVLFWGEFRP